MLALRIPLGLSGVWLGAAVLLGATTSGLAAPQLPEVPPTRLEAFAAQPGVKTSWSKFIGILDGGKSYVIVSAVALKAAGPASEQMRGIRIEPRHEGLRPTCGLMHVEWAVMCDRELATAYVEENRLEALRMAVLGGGASVHPGHPSGITYYRASSGGVTTASGLLVLGYSLQDRTLEEFAAMVEKAITELKSAPR